MPSSRSVMASSLASELARFRRGGKQLRRILKQTKHVHESIKKKGCYAKEQLDKFALKPEDESAVWNIIEQPVGFVVLGSSCWARATVINTIMERNILPIVPFEETDHHWRMVRFSYGKTARAKLVLPSGYEILDRLKFNENLPVTIPLTDLELKPNNTSAADSIEDPALTGGGLEVILPHPLLYDNAQVIVAPERNQVAFMQELKKCLNGITPILIYAIGNSLSEQDISDLTELKELPYKLPIFFTCVRHPSESDLTESGQHAGGHGSASSSGVSSPASSCPPSPTSPKSPSLNMPYTYSRHPLEQLSLLRHCGEVQSAEQFPVSSEIYQKLARLGFLAPPGSRPEYKGSLEVGNELVEEFVNFSSVLMFVSHVLQSRLLLAATLLQDTHARSLQNFIMAAFDLSRDLMITPKRIQYARQKEEGLYMSLLNLAYNKQDEIRHMITDTIFEIRDEVLKSAAELNFRGALLEELLKESLSARVVHLCTTEIRDMVVEHVNKAVSAKLSSSIEWLQEKFTGTLERCLNSLEQASSDDESAKLASGALKHILNAAYSVEVSFKNSASIFWFFVQKMQQLAEVLPWKLPTSINTQWKQEVALRMLSSLNEVHLSRSISYQLQQKVRASHERFVASLSQLEERHLDRLEQREHERKNVRCLYAPQIAKLSLESSSLKDMIQYGMPPLGQELGRGHFGIVHSCKSWAGQSNLAVKSVALPTDKHWYSLAMEFYYHKNTPEHPRIVRLCGTVIDYKHDRRPTVLLIMERLSRDLYSALWNGIPWMQRLQVAIDVIQGIRYLHSQGLVHRDIKLHNVLLDKENRAKLSDLGFCKVEVMMSGSVVGTPIHMAPELLTGHYDNSVDIYAFGVLFWYLCSGQPRLPYVYEQCSHKEDLFALIKRGMRPERLPYFDEECWDLMSECWKGDPSKRPLPGEVERRLEDIQTKFSAQKRFVKSELSCNELTMSHGSDCWSTYDTSSRSYTVVSESFAG